MRLPSSLPSRTLVAALQIAFVTLPVAHATNASQPLVAVSVPAHAALVERLAGDWVDVALMLPPGASPVHYAPGLRERARLARAALYVKVGHPHFPFERAWLAPLLDETKTLRVLDASAGGVLAEHDPHWWLSPPRARSAAARVASALADLVPEQSALIAERARALGREIASLDRELAGTLAAHRGARFLVFHPAWGYFAEHYGLEQIAIEHEHKEPGLSQLAALVRRAQRDRVQYVIVQPQLAPAGAQVIAQEIGARVVVADPLAADWPGELRKIAALVAGESAP